MCRRPEQRGQEGQALGRSRGGFTTKIHAKSDASGDIIAFDLTGGKAFDGRHFEILLDIGPDIQPRAVICDKGYASKANRDAARARGVAPVIPHKANEKNKPAFFARTLYKARARIEQGVGRLKRFKRVALRCEKTERNFKINRQLRCRPLLDQIRPHRLGQAGDSFGNKRGAEDLHSNCHMVVEVLHKTNPWRTHKQGGFAVKKRPRSVSPPASH